MKYQTPQGGLVYSTDSGRMCPGCRRAVDQCTCSQAAARPAGDGIVRVSRESKGRGGKVVTLVKGLALSDAELTVFAKQLKAACGCGGAVKDGVVEIQGDHVERLMGVLQAQGYRIKRAGG
jgi:translation initiation factor 1